MKSNTRLQDIWMETEAGIDPVQFKVGTVRQTSVQELPGTFDVLDALWW